MLIDLLLSEDEQVECARHVVALQYYYANLVEERRKHPGEDIISDLIRYRFAEDDLHKDATLECPGAGSCSAQTSQAGIAVVFCSCWLRALDSYAEVNK